MDSFRTEILARPTLILGLTFLLERRAGMISVKELG